MMWVEDIEGNKSRLDDVKRVVLEVAVAEGA